MPKDSNSVPHGTIPAALGVVFAGPDNFDRGLGGFGDVNGFDYEVGGGVGAAAEASA